MIYKCIKIDLPLVVYTFGQCQFNMRDVHNSIKGSYMSAHLNKFSKKIREKGSTVRFVKQSIGFH